MIFQLTNPKDEIRMTNFFFVIRHSSFEIF